MSRHARCKSCGEPMLWARTGEGKLMPLDVQAEAGPAPRLVAFNPQSGRCLVLSADDVESGRAAGWVKAGARVHRSHWESCPGAERHRVAPGQESLL